MPIFRRLLDVILPRSSLLMRLEEMSAGEFRRTASRADKGLFEYRDPLVKTAIWQIKYRNHKKISRLLAEILYEEILGELADLGQFADFREPILVPIPLSPTRKRARGYNQSENLVTEIMKLDGGRVLTAAADVLIKIKETAPQSSLPRALRLKNLEGCFKVKNPEKIRGRNIILIDDVSTTGATLREAALTLESAAARKVIAVTVAH